MRQGSARTLPFFVSGGLRLYVGAQLLVLRELFVLFATATSLFEPFGWRSTLSSPLSNKLSMAPLSAWRVDLSALP